MMADKGQDFLKLMNFNKMLMTLITQKPLKDLKRQKK
jgi:hypothetical protein